MRKFVSLVMSVLMCFSLSTAVSAQTIPANFIQPYYEMAADADSDLYISGTTASCTSKVNGFSNVVKITINQYLQKQGFLWIWSTYDGAEWEETEYSSSYTMTNTKTGLTSGNYRLKSVFTLTDKDGKKESFTVYSGEVTVS